MTSTWKDIDRRILPGTMRVGGDEQSGPILDLQDYDGHRARIAMFGGQLLGWQPAGHTPVLWLSKGARFDQHNEIRGGVPACWPWFGRHSAHADWPLHGIARTAPWDLLSVDEDDQGTCVRLELPETDDHSPFWPHKSRPVIAYRYGKQLQIELDVINYDAHPIEYGQALHTYFAVGDIDDISIHGLETSPFFDKLTTTEHPASTAPITIDQEIDRIYQNPTRPIELRDTKLSRTLTITHEGADNVVVWNPWIEKTKRLGDMGSPAAYRGMVCIETANVAPNAIRLEPGETHTLKTTISVCHHS